MPGAIKDSPFPCNYVRACVPTFTWSDPAGKLIKSGMWFDDKGRVGERVRQMDDPMYAPQYMLQNSRQYENLLNVTPV